MKTETLSAQNQRICGQCRYFQTDEWNTGYCQYHKMFVLNIFDCRDFARRDNDAEGGDAALKVQAHDAQELRQAETV